MALLIIHYSNRLIHYHLTLEVDNIYNEARRKIGCKKDPLKKFFKLVYKNAIILRKGTPWYIFLKPQVLYLHNLPKPSRYPPTMIFKLLSTLS